MPQEGNMAMFAFDFNRGNRTPRERLSRAKDRLERAEAELRAAKEQFDRAAAEVVSYEEWKHPISR